MFYLKFFVIVIWLLICCIVGLAASPFRWRDPSLNRLFARIFSTVSLKILGIRLTVEGQENIDAHGPCVYVANHQSALDISTFGVVFPQRTICIGKKEIKWIPFFGLMFYAFGNVMIDRQSRVRAINMLSDVLKEVKEKEFSIWIHPEGTRSASGTKLLPFKRGVFRMALEAQVPLVPYVCSPIHKVISVAARKIPGGELTVRILPPISTEGMSLDHTDELMEKTWKIMNDAFVSMAVTEAEQPS